MVDPGWHQALGSGLCSQLKDYPLIDLAGSDIVREALAVCDSR